MSISSHGDRASWTNRSDICTLDRWPSVVWRPPVLGNRICMRTACHALLSLYSCRSSTCVRNQDKNSLIRFVGHFMLGQLPFHSKVQLSNLRNWWTIILCLLYHWFDQSNSLSGSIEFGRRQWTISVCISVWRLFCRVSLARRKRFVIS